MCQHNLPCSIVYAHCLLPGRAFASLYVLLFLEKEAEIGGRVFCDTQKYTIGDDATTVVVVFCRQSHLGCTDMSLQQNRDKNA